MKLVSLLLMLVLTACASTVIEPTYYLMRADDGLQSRKLTPSSDFVLGNVVIASYIDQHGLVIETSDGVMRAAQHHLWAEPVYEGVRNQLTVKIAQATGEDLLPAKLGVGKIVLDIEINQLHGTDQGTAKLVAYWLLRQGDKVLSAYQFAEQQPLTTSGYSALVAAEGVLLEKLAREIAATLVKSPD